VAVFTNLAMRSTSSKADKMTSTALRVPGGETMKSTETSALYGSEGGGSEGRGGGCGGCGGREGGAGGAVTTGGEEIYLIQISPEPTGSEEPCGDRFKRGLKVPRVRSVKFCSSMAVEEADLVVLRSAG